MGRASSNKKVARAAKAGGGRARAAGERNILFPTALAAVVILGTLLVVYARDERSAEALAAPLSNEDHWHAAYGVYVCDASVPDLPEFTAPQNGGNHTHGDGLFHIHPFSPARAGENATLVNWFEDAGAVLGGGDQLEDDRLGVPGGAIELAEGSTLSFHGTPLAGELTGSVALDGVTVARDDVALKGGPGRGELRLAYRREGDKALVDGALTNLSMSTDAVVRKSANGDYVSLGKGKLSGGALSLHAEVPVDARGMPKLDGLPALSNTSVTVGSFVGDLKSARMTAGAERGGSVQLGPSHLEGAMSFSEAKGLTLKGTVDSLDAEVSDVNVKQPGRSVSIERGRLKGRAGTVDLSPGRVAVDAKQLSWDVTARELSATPGQTTLKAGQVRVTGEGRFAYDSQKDLRVEGRLHVECRANTDTRLNRSVTINRKTGVRVN